jgi:predicted metalloprotease
MTTPRHRSHRVHPAGVALAGLLWAAATAAATATTVAAPPAAAAGASDTSSARIESARRWFRDVETFWSGEIAALGGQYRGATLLFYDAPLDRGCEVAGPLRGPFYCPSAETVYLDREYLQRLTGPTTDITRAALGYVVAHELAHHIQALVGTTLLMEQARARSTRALAGRTLTVYELQADCYAGLMLRWEAQRGSLAGPPDPAALLDAVAAIGPRSDAPPRVPGQWLDPLTHGTPAQRLKWLRVGLDGGDFNACDTFGAEAAGRL